MRITSIHVENFKSLVDFDLDLAKFTCLIGLNGSGKSTVLQFIDFLAQQMRGKLDEWLEVRGWKAGELKSMLTTRRNIEFDVHFDTEHPNIPGRWRGTFNPRQLRCTSEAIEVAGARLQVAEGNLSMGRNGTSMGLDDDTTKSNIPFKYQGSILSQLQDKRVAEELMEFRRFVAGIDSLDMLSPHYLRQRTRESAGSLGLGGQKLSAFLHELGGRNLRQLLKRLETVYPRLCGLHAKSLRSGWKQLEIIEAYPGEPPGFVATMTTEARHVNDGMLRMIAILAELQSEHPFLLFDEIENGINPEVVEFVLDALIATVQQVMVTTHSPMILNYLDDKIAEQGVIYLYKTEEGHTKSIHFFSIPSLKKKLAVMGPGEAFVDTNLTELAAEIADVTTEKA
ncbi:MAG TPA: AAA family ATPase [Pirellulales bacterium]|nr:AAA family ATPase [Pirellulales bacterium]